MLIKYTLYELRLLCSVENIQFMFNYNKYKNYL